MNNWLRAISIAGFISLGTTVMFGQSNSSALEHWVATWGTAQDMGSAIPERPQLPPNIKMPDFSAMMKGKAPQPQAPISIENQTIRMMVRTGLAGKKVRIEISNAIAKGVVSIGAAHVAIRTKDSTIDVRSDRKLTFSGSPSVELQAGAVLVSDPVDLDVPAMTDLAVSLYVVKCEGAPSNHTIGLHTSYISKGDTTSAASMPNAETTSSYLWLRSIDVTASGSDYAVVCLGDSITDGFGAEMDTDHAWPSLLAKRFNERKSGPRVGVLNEGISGNEVLHNGAGMSALARFDRDVLSEPGVRWIVLLEGINDINIHGQITGPNALVAEDLIKGYRQLIARAHMHGIKIMGATLTPEEGVWLAGPVGEATRLKVNEWIRTSREFDAVVDFDAVVRDPQHTARIRQEFNPGDSIHPNNIGNEAMANAFDLAMFDK